ncbi:hypothetical protein NBRC116494_23710 [Aurantivibrio plasticivorans]
MENSVDVFNSIGASFDSSGKDKSTNPNRWEFRFDQGKNEISLDVTLVAKEVVIVGECGCNLKSSLKKSDVSQLIQWLYRVKTILND